MTGREHTVRIEALRSAFYHEFLFPGIFTVAVMHIESNIYNQYYGDFRHFSPPLQIPLVPTNAHNSVSSTSPLSGRPTH